MSLVSSEGRVYDVIDFVGEINVGVENPHAIVVIVAHFDVLEDVVAKVNLQGGLERVSAVVEQTSSFNLVKMEKILKLFFSVVKTVCLPSHRRVCSSWLSYPAEHPTMIRHSTSVQHRPRECRNSKKHHLSRKVCT